VVYEKGGALKWGGASWLIELQGLGYLMVKDAIGRRKHEHPGGVPCKMEGGFGRGLLTNRERREEI